LLATTDRFDDTWADMAGYAYSRMAVERYLQNTEFDFWADMGGHYIFNDMVNAYLYNGWFFRNVIAPKHIPYMYDRMLLQVLFYQASLRHYDHAITRNTTALLEKPHPSPTHPAATNAGISKIRKQRADFIRFTNQYWFREVSNQMQGKMIFRLQYQGLGIDAYYQQLEGEIVRTNEYLQVLHENRLAEEAGKAGKQANKLAGIAAALALIAALPVVNEVFKNEGLWGKLASRGAEYFGISLFSAQSLMAGLLVAVPGLVAWLFWRGKN